jgi:hypothetical protein
MVTRNANQATGGTPQNNSGGLLKRVLSRSGLQTESAHRQREHQGHKNLSLTGFYTLSFANGNNNGSATSTPTTWTRTTGAPALLRATRSS